MLEDYRDEIHKLKVSIVKHKKKVIAMSLALIIILGTLAFLGESLDGGDDEFHSNKYSRAPFGDGHGGDIAIYNPAGAIINLSIVTGCAFAAGCSVFILIRSRKKHTAPLPVLFNPGKEDER